MSSPNQQIEQLYIKMYDYLLQYAKSALGNYALAEEAVQDTFQIACQKPDDVINSIRPEGWLVNTLKYVISNMLRNRANANRIMMAYLATQSRDISIVEDHMRFDIMYGDIVHTEEFQLLKEMAVDGLSHYEMAKKRGITVASCRKRVQRAKEHLRKILME